MYYNYPPGKAAVGASYLNVAESLANILQRLEREGYDLGGRDLSADGVLHEITTSGRNVGGYAPGELEALLEAAARFRRPDRLWHDYRSMARRVGARARCERRSSPIGVRADEDTALMADRRRPEATASDRFPCFEYGNVVVLPAAGARAGGEDDDKLYHAKDLAPHHQYVADLCLAQARVQGRR